MEAGERCRTFKQIANALLTNSLYSSLCLTVLQITHLPQTNPQGYNSCVPAAVRMVLTFLGVALGEEELCNLLETQQVGTPVLNQLLLSHVSLDVMPK